MKPRLAGSSSAITEPRKSGMPSKLTANRTIAARPHSISSTSRTTPKIASVPVRVCQASSESPKSGRWPRSSRMLVWYMPRQRNGPTSRKLAASTSVYAGASSNTRSSAQPMPTKQAP